MIAQGKMKTWFAENVLLEQPFVKDDSKTVGDLLKSAGLKLVRFVRYELPIKIPARNTRVPPSTIWNAAERNGVSMYR